jgi:hypothetical protein
VDRLLELLRTRRGVVAGGLALVIAAVAVFTVLGGVQPSETLAVALYVVIVAAALFTGLRGALGAALFSSIIYFIVRGTGPLESSSVGPVLLRVLSYFGFAAATAAGLSLITGKTHRLDTGPSVDVRSGLATVTRLVEIIDHEIARSTRYARIFSVALIEMPPESTKGASQDTMFGELGDLVREAIRTTDFAGIRGDSRGMQLVMILPETPSTGAGIFAQRFGERLADSLMRYNVAVSRNPATWYEFPGQANDVRRIRNELARIADLPLAIANSGARRT